MDETFQPVTTKRFYGKKHYSYQIRDIPSDSEDSVLADEEDQIPEYQNLDEILTSEGHFDPEDEIPLSNFVNATSSTKSKMKQLLWEERQTFTDNDKTQFCGTTDLPQEILELCTPYAIFKLFFTDEFLKLIADLSMLYSVQTNPNRPFVTTVDEIKKFIGVLLWMSIIKLPSTRMYWSADTRVPQVADIMPVNRFHQIKKKLHFNDNLQMENKIEKIQPVIDHIRRVCNKIPMEENLSCDEQIVPFKGKISIKTYNPKKPHKWGYKLWVLSGISGFSYDFELFTGKVSSVEGEKDFGSASNVVLRMSRSISKNLHHKLYCDNYFTSIPLFSHLSQNGIDCVGTVRTNRLMGCSFPTEKQWKKKGRGSFVEKIANHENQQIKAIQWYDNKVVTLLSSFAGSQPSHTVQRFCKSEKVKKDVACPDIVKVYNKHMGGVDLLDSLLGLYRIRTRSKKWYHKLFFHMIDVVICNSWLLYRRISRHHNLDQPDNFGQLSLLQFRIELAKVLTTIGTSNVVSNKRGRPSNATPEPQHKTRKHREASPSFETRTDGIGHWPQHSNQRNRCRLDGCNGKSRMFCTKCKVYLCLYDEKKCFVDYHL